MAGHAVSGLLSAVTHSAADDSIRSSSVAFELAAALHRDLQSCVDDEHAQQKICGVYRNKILYASQFTDVLASALSDAFPKLARPTGRGKDAEAWLAFGKLAKQQHSRPNQAAQKLQHQTSVVAIWGPEVFQHYGWEKLPLVPMRSLKNFAQQQRKWTLAVELINNVLLERHGCRVIENDNRSQLIGEHPRGSIIQDSRSPVEYKDIQKVLDRLRSGATSSSYSPQGSNAADNIEGTPIQKFGLERDRFGRIVPHGAPGVVPKDDEQGKRGHKRRRSPSDSGGESSEAGDLPTTPIPARPRVHLTTTTDPELSDLDENRSEAEAESPRVVDSTSVDTGEQSPRSGLSTRRGAASSSRDPTTSSEERQAPSVASGSASSTRALTNKEPIDLLPDHNGNNDRPQRTSLSSPSQDESSIPQDSDVISPSAGEEDFSFEAIGPALDERTRHMTVSERASDDGQDLCFVAQSGVSGALDHASDVQLPSDPHEPNSSFRRLVGLRETPQAGEESILGSSSPITTPATDSQGSGHSISSVIEQRPDSTSEAGIVPTDHEMSSQGGAGQGIGVFSVQTKDGRFLPVSREQPATRLCTDVSDVTGHSIIDCMARKYSGQLKELLKATEKQRNNRQPSAFIESKYEWLSSSRWANIYSDPEDDLGPTTTKRDEADVWYMSWETFRRRADDGEIFRKPVVIKQRFQDSGIYHVSEYVTHLKERFPQQNLDVQNSETGDCQSVAMDEFCSAVLDGKECRTEVAPAMSNVINLRRFANADAPVFTRMRRFRLLETLLDLASEHAPGKRTHVLPTNVSDCLGFNLLGFGGAFTRPHVDALSGTWVRCLSGAKPWTLVSAMSENDWADFAREGADWRPAGKGRMLVLEVDDVILMPPALRTPHNVFGVGPSLMEGGMIWDERCIPTLLEELLWISQNQLCTNEAVAYQLPSILDALEVWVQEKGTSVCGSTELCEYMSQIERGIEKLRDTGCRCARSCSKEPSCQCQVRGRRCTVWCFGHPTMPGKRKDQYNPCMVEA